MRDNSVSKAKRGAFPVLFLISLLPFLFRQTGTLAPILFLPEILLKLAISLGHLLLAKLVTILFLLQHKQQIFLPVALRKAASLWDRPPQSEQSNASRYLIADV
jgi:hypothetical protein